MTFSSYPRADAALYDEIRALDARCRVSDGTHAKLDFDTALNFTDRIDALFCAREAGVLVGILSVFALDSSEAEFSARVHPDFRNRGVFKQLFSMACAAVSSENISSILLLCEPESESGKALIKHLGASYDHREFTLRREAPPRRDEKDETLRLRRCGQADVASLCALNRAIYGDSEALVESFVRRCTQSPSRTYYILSRGEKDLALLAADHDGEECFFFGVGVAPEERRKGYGKQLLLHAMDAEISRGATLFFLCVDSENAPARALYNSVGLRAFATTDYFRIESLQ